MNLLQELRARRVPQFVSAYVVGGWGLVQFFTFLEGRMLMSPHLVNALSLALLLLLPSVAVLAWCHGRPGTDRWGRTEKVSIPVNLVAAGVVLVALFADKDLGAVTQTVSVQDENGTTVERVIPKAEHRHRAMFYYLENGGPAEDDWLRQALCLALVIDLNQDPFLDVEYPATRVAALRRLDHPDGLGLPRPLMRELAREAHCPHFISGTYRRTAEGLVLDLVIHSADTGHEAGTVSVTAPDLFTAVDQASLQIRRELGVPAAHLEQQEDLPIADILTGDVDALRDFSQGAVLATHANDWTAATAPLEDAVARDPHFALAYFLLYAVRITNGDEPGANAAMTSAMENLYRLSERSQFQVKAIYYFNVKQDPDKARAVVDMWTRLYPDDVSAYQQAAGFARLRQDYPAMIAAFERILAIDPAQHQVLVQLADVYQEQGDFTAAEKPLRRYAELYPTDVRSFTQLASLHEDAGRLEEARKDLEQAQIVAPDRPATLRDLAGIDAKLGHWDQAETALRDLRAQAGNTEDALAAVESLSYLARARGRTRATLDLLDEWAELARTTTSPSQVALAHGIQLSQLESPALADSLAAAVAALRPIVGRPNSRMIGMCEARLLVQTDALDRAAEALAETEAFVDEYQIALLKPRVMIVSGALAERRGDLAEALRIHREAAAMDPTSTLHQRRIAHLQRLTGDLDGAAKTLAALLPRDPAQPETNLELALLAEARGKPAEAREPLRTALEAWRGAAPDHPGAAAAAALARRLEQTP